MTPEIQAQFDDFKSRIKNLEDEFENLKQPFTISYDIDRSLRERLGFPNIYIDIVAPVSRPFKIGDIFIDRFLAKVYIATGVTSSSDWSILN